MRGTVRYGMVGYGTVKYVKNNVQILRHVQYVDILRPLLYHEFFQTLIRAHSENINMIIPGIFKMSFTNNVSFKVALKDMGPSPGP